MRCVAAQAREDPPSLRICLVGRSCARVFREEDVASAWGGRRWKRTLATTTRRCAETRNWGRADR
eukprot:1439666-Pyramimonas_sp.AAC.1